jgi:mitochondrial import inner membrane translocase subunit TIM44
MKGSSMGKRVISRFASNLVDPIALKLPLRSSTVPSNDAFAYFEQQPKRSDSSNFILPIDRRRTFSTSSESNSTGKPSLKETVERLQRENDGSNAAENGATSESSQKSNPSGNNDVAFGDILRRTADVWDKLKSELSSTWQDLVQSGERKSINKKIVVHHPTETAAGDAPYTGRVDIMVLDPDLHLTAWERMQKRLTAAPIIQSILEKSEELYEKSGAKKVKERVDHIKEDAREAWETSQNPWVYRLSSVYDTVTAESPETRAVAELRVLDPTFTLEEWRLDVVEHTIPIIMRWFLQGRVNQLKPWFGEGVFKRIAAEMIAREKEGVQIDTNVLAIMNSEIIAVEVCLLCCHLESLNFVTLS